MWEKKRWPLPSQVSGFVYFLFAFFGIEFSTFTEKAMATHCSTLAWKIPWTEEPGRLKSMGS